MPTLKSIYHAVRHRAAARWLNGPRRDTVQIAITGSYGKTSITGAVHALLDAHFETVRTDENLDTIYNVPITALQVRARHRYAVFELGIDTPGEMDFHLRIVRPRISIISGITPVHSDEKHVGSLEHIIQQKGRIIDVLEPGDTAILNGDDPEVRAMAPRTQGRVIFYGSGEDCSYRVSDVQLSLSGTSFDLTTPHGSVAVRTGLLGAHNAANLAAAAACAHAVGLELDDMLPIFAGLQPLEGRFSINSGPNQLILINDTLRANPASTKAGLRFLAGIPTHSRRIAVLGEMGELGDHAVREHRSVGETAAKTDPSLLIAVGELTQHTAQAAGEQGLPAERIHAVQNVHAAARLLEEKGRPGDIVYLKGSLLRHMERIPLLLAGKAVGCRVVSCPFYHQCMECEYLVEGYNG